VNNSNFVKPCSVEVHKPLLVMLLALQLLASAAQSAQEVGFHASATASGARLPADKLADAPGKQRMPPQSLSPVPSGKMQDAKPLDPAMLRRELRSYVQDIHHFTFKPNLMFSLEQVRLEESEPVVIFEYEVDAAYDTVGFRDGTAAESLMKRYCVEHGFEALVSNNIPAVFKYTQDGAIVFEQKIDSCELLEII
jgi:hypothetical protein